MLTPAFSVKQETGYLTFHIKAPLAKISETEVYIDGTEFKFYSKPYYLRLNLPGELRNDSEQAKYIADEGCFVIRVDKEKAGEHFEGLDMLTKLLAPVGSRSVTGPLIEVIDSSCADDSVSGDIVEEEDDDFDWQVEQEPYIEETVSVGAPTYGFAGQKCGLIGRMQSELHGVIDLNDADKVPVVNRRALRMQDEEDRFDDDHYLADLYEDEAILPLLHNKPCWDVELKLIKEGNYEDSAVKLTDDEKEKMLKLPRKEYLLSKKEVKIVMMGMVDILFAYCYDQRVTGGESTVESPWTICKLSATLSWFERFKNVDDVLTSCFRRSLTYPLYRHFKLSKKVFKDTCSLFKIGRRRLLKCLLDIHSILQSGDNTYVLNDLYITDYCVWIQHVREKHIRSMADALEKVKIRKGDLELDLIELERAADLVLDEQLQRGMETDATDKAEANSSSNTAKDEEGLVADATSALQGLHIQNPYASETTETRSRENLDGKTCTCGGINTEGAATAATLKPCEYCSKIQDSGTEDSSVSSDTPSDSSDSSDYSDSSTSDSESEGSEKEETKKNSCVLQVERNLRE